jgi:hypothetical protein
MAHAADAGDAGQRRQLRLQLPPELVERLSRAIAV